MEFNKKLQELRKQKGLTQEELAQALYVSRTAISKWESGRGFPSIDSLKIIAKFFNVSIDELLSGDQILTIAEEDQKLKNGHLRDLFFGMLDLSTALFLILPFFGQKNGDTIQAVPLSSLSNISPLLKTAYLIAVFSMVVFGIATLALQNYANPVWLRTKGYLSILLTAIGILLFIISPQPYAAALLFVFLLIKLLILLKKQ